MIKNIDEDLGMSKFNPITYAKQLKNAGMPKEQADILAEEFLNAITDNLATKEDLNNVEHKLDHVEQKLDTKIDTIYTILLAKINTVDLKLNWMMSLIGFIGFLLTLLNFFHIH